jgi:hypothetical protein
MSRRQTLRTTRASVSTFAAITANEAGSRSLGDIRVDTAIPQGRWMLDPIRQQTR